MVLLGLDFETTGLSVSEARIIQAGLILYDTDSKKSIEEHSLLCYSPDYPPMYDGADKAHGMDRSFLIRFAKTPLEVFGFVSTKMDDAEYIVAHNGNNFDKPMWEHEAYRHNIVYSKKHWVDTRVDIDFPKNMTSRRLNHLAADHGIHNQRQHDALSDIRTMLDILSYYDIDQVIDRSKSPLVKLIANTTFDQKEAVKSRRFIWDNANKRWYKFVRQSDVEQEVKSAGFEITTEEVT